MAAVGAGMIPAAAAMLVPIVLGRKRRSLHHQMPPSSSFAKTMRNQ